VTTLSRLKATASQGRTLKAQSEPQNITSGVEVTTNTKVTIRANMLTVSESLRDRETTLGAQYRCLLGIHGDRCATSLFRFVAQDTEELTPSSIANALSQAVIFDHASDIQILVGDEVILLSQLSGYLMFKIKPLSLHLKVSFSYQDSSLPSPMRAFDPTRKPSLSLSQQLLTMSKILGIVYHRVIREHGEGLQADINPYGVDAGLLFWLVCQFTTEDGIPLTTETFEADCLNYPFDRAMQPDTDSPHILDVELISEPNAIAISREGDRVEAVSGLKTRITWLFSCLNSMKEGFERLIQSSQHILSSRVVESSTPGILLADLFELVSLVIVVSRDTLLPGITSLLESSVIEETSDIQETSQCSILSPVGIQPIDESLPHLLPLLSLDIFPDRILADMPHCSSVVAPRPETGEFSPKFGKLRTQDMRRVTLKLVDDMLNCLGRLTSDKYVNVVGVNLHYLNLNTHLLRLKVKQLAQTLSDLWSKHLFPILRTPDQVILDVVNTTSVSLISVAHRHYYTTVNSIYQALLGKEVWAHSSVA
jgi:hypothetical protein